MGELGNVNFEVFNDSYIDSYDDKKDIKKKIIDELPAQNVKFKKQILPYIRDYLSKDILDKFFTDTLKTPITKIYSSHYSLGVGSKKFAVKKNTSNIEKIFKTIDKDLIFKTIDKDFVSAVTLTISNYKKNTKYDNIELNDNLSLVDKTSSFITALKKYILDLSNLLNLLKNNEENIKNIYALVNNQHIKVKKQVSNHKLLPKKRSFRFADTNVTAKQLNHIEDDSKWEITKLGNSLVHFGNDITLPNLKKELKLFQLAYGNIKTFINGADSVNKYNIKDIGTYIRNIKQSQTDLITSLKDINNDFDYTKDTPHSIFAGKITDDNKNEYENILNLLEDITANKALLEQINKSKKDIKIYLDHHNEDKEVKVIELVESTRDIEIDKQLKAFNNSEFYTSILSKSYSTLSTSYENIKSKGLDYLDTVIKIIIFLIFLNLFITTYFYFTTSIEATANRSNCGGASLCEAETHRHLFLEDNGNDKARDIYIIIVVIFSIYLLSEIFKNSKDGINFNNTDTEINFIKKVFIFVCFFGSMLLAQFAKYYFDKHKNKQNFSENIKNPPMFGFMIAYSVLSVLAIIICFLIAYLYGQSSRIIKIIMGIIVFISLGYDIHNFINKSTSDSFESKSFNSKFKA